MESHPQRVQPRAGIDYSRKENGKNQGRGKQKGPILGKEKFPHGLKTDLRLKKFPLFVNRPAFGLSVLNALVPLQGIHWG